MTSYIKPIQEVVGEVLTHVDIDDTGGEIMLTTASGKKIMIYHKQSCCEYVRIENTQGDFHDLIGKVIIEATAEEIPNGDPPPERPDSWTRTNLTFRAIDTTVISRWIGESNGYYSESVDWEEIPKHRQW